MLQLPNLDETNDPVIKKLILAIQELSDQVGQRDTVIFNSIDQEIKDFRQEMKNAMKVQTDLLRQIAENTKK